MNIAEQIHLKLQLKESSEIEYKSAAGGFPKAEFWRSFSALANTDGGTIVLGKCHGVGVLARVSYAETLCKTRNQFQE